MKLTITLIILMILAFVIIAVQPAETQEHILHEFGFSRATLAQKPWTPLTSVFLHADLMHLLSNILVLLFFGIAVEEELGIKKYLTIFILAAIAGSGAAFFYYAPDVVSIGASAAIFGLVGVGMLVRPASMSMFPYIIPIPLAIIGILYIFYNIYGFIVDPMSSISYTAHFGGLAIGLLAGVYERGMAHALKIMLLALVGLVAIGIAYMFFVNSLTAGII